MTMYDIIQKKRNGGKLSAEEIEFFVNGYTCGDIPDYQASALLMAIYFNGMDDEETVKLTECMRDSGDSVDLSRFGELSVDKHSTGGVGDKTTLIVAPIVACLGGKMAKMSGRGLGHTGGTVDKLESIPGYKTELTPYLFMETVEKTGLAVIGQSGNLAPADKKIYALRDVTATVESIPLIASSIMSKKLAAGAKSIVLDVKVGSGAFMKTEEQAKLLAEKMVNIGKGCGRNVAALITNMDVPLGKAVGNALEVQEAVEILKGEGDEQLRDICLALSAQMLSLCRNWELPEALEKATHALKSGAALEQFRKWIKAQGGDDSFVDAPLKLHPATFIRKVRVVEDGYICAIDAETVGKCACLLGAGREQIGQEIDFSAGVVMEVKPGQRVEIGDVIAQLHSSKAEKMDEAAKMILSAVTIEANEQSPQRLIYGVVR